MTSFLSNLHTHTIFSDGSNAPEEMVLAAIEKGYESLGFSEHSPSTYSPACAMKTENIGKYFAEITRLKEEYAGKIEVYLGIESDMLIPFDKSGLDFTIGSVHDVLDSETDTAYTIDWRHETFAEAIKVIGGGDVRLLVKRYYEMVADMLKSYKPDIIGHTDIITKINGGNRYFDENSSWYRQEQEEISQKIAASGLIVEINTGGIAGRYKTEPYPSVYMLSVMRELDVPVTLSSDSHSTGKLGFWFDEALALLRRLGYRSLRIMRGGVFVEEEI